MAGCNKKEADFWFSTKSRLAAITASSVVTSTAASGIEILNATVPSPAISSSIEPNKLG